MVHLRTGDRGKQKQDGRPFDTQPYLCSSSSRNRGGGASVVLETENLFTPRKVRLYKEVNVSS